MAGLDTRGAVDGFMRGFSFVDNYFDKEQGKERQAGLDAERQDDRRYSRERNEMLDQERHDQTEFSQGLQLNQDARAASQDTRAASAERRAAAAHTEAERLRTAQEGWATWESKGEFSDEQAEFFRKNPDLNPNKFMDEKVRDSIRYFVEASEKGDLDDDDKLIKFVNTPDTLEAMNSLFARQINKGGGGKKRIARILPGQKEGTLVFELEVTGEDGKTSRKPMTAERGTDDQEIKQVPIEQVTEHIVGMAQLSSMVDNMSPEARSRAADYGVRMGFLKKIDGADSAKNRYVVVGGQLWDAVAKKYIPRPDNDKDTKELAQKMAVSEFEAQSEFSKDRKPLKDFYEDALKTLSADRASSSAQNDGKPGLQAEGDSADTGLQGSGTKEDPYKTASQSDVDWFKSKAPSGAVISINGKLYTKQ